MLAKDMKPVWVVNFP